jgi:hypothetical protein
MSWPRIRDCRRARCLRFLHSGCAVSQRNLRRRHPRVQALSGLSTSAMRSVFDAEPLKYSTALTHCTAVPE